MAMVRREFHYGVFARSIPLPATVQGDHATAQLKEGILEVRIPKSEKSKAKQIPIQTQGAERAGWSHAPSREARPAGTNRAGGLRGSEFLVGWEDGQEVGSASANKWHIIC